ITVMEKSGSNKPRKRGEEEEIFEQRKKFPKISNATGDITDFASVIVKFCCLDDLIAVSQVNRQFREHVTSDILAERCICETNEEGKDPARTTDTFEGQPSAVQDMRMYFGWEDMFLSKEAMIAGMGRDDALPGFFDIVAPRLRQHGRFEQNVDGFTRDLQVEVVSSLSTQAALDKADEMFQDISTRDMPGNVPWI
ncbi:MAG: hypothetical protein SGILL_008655, partial [Bacillariaceae sp.]